MADSDNSLSALFLGKDYFDWYNGYGYRTAGYFHINNYLSIGAEYNSLTQSNMNNVWQGYRSSYKIEEGSNVYLKSIVTAGYPVDIATKKIQMYSTFIRTNSMENSDIDYNNEHFFFNVFIPYSDALDFNMKIMAGASDVQNSRFRDEGYKQNIFEIGGKGTLRGYGWKAIPSSHYQLSTLEIWYSFIGLFYDRVIIFDSPGNTFNQNYLNDMIDNIAQTDYHSIGIGFQPKEEFRLSFVQALSGNKETTMYFTLTTPVHYW